MLSAPAMFLLSLILVTALSDAFDSESLLQINATDARGSQKQQEYCGDDKSVTVCMTACLHTNAKKQAVAKRALCDSACTKMGKALHYYKWGRSCNAAHGNANPCPHVALCTIALMDSVLKRSEPDLSKQPKVALAFKELGNGDPTQLTYHMHGPLATNGPNQENPWVPIWNAMMEGDESLRIWSPVETEGRANNNPANFAQPATLSNYLNNMEPLPNMNQQPIDVTLGPEVTNRWERLVKCYANSPAWVHKFTRKVLAAAKPGDEHEVTAMWTILGAIEGALAEGVHKLRELSKIVGAALSKKLFEVAMTVAFPGAGSTVKVAILVFNELVDATKAASDADDKWQVLTEVIPAFWDKVVRSVATYGLALAITVALTPVVGPFMVLLTPLIDCIAKKVVDGLVDAAKFFAKQGVKLTRKFQWYWRGGKPSREVIQDDVPVIFS